MTNRALRAASVVLLLSLLAGCSRRDYADQRYPLTGEVTVDGKPMDSGAISFIPAGGEKQRVSGGPILDGKYSVSEEQGANAGKYRVEIRWAKLTGRQMRDGDTGTMVDERKEGLPAKFHTNSELAAEVGEDNTKFDFHLKSN